MLKNSNLSKKVQDFCFKRFVALMLGVSMLLSHTALAADPPDDAGTGIALRRNLGASVASGTDLETGMALRTDLDTPIPDYGDVPLNYEAFAQLTEGLNYSTTTRLSDDTQLANLSDTPDNTQITNFSEILDANISPLATISDVYDPGYYVRTIDVIRYENTSETFWTNMSGEVVWFSDNSDIVKVNGYTQQSCAISYLKPGTTKLTMSNTYTYFDSYLGKSYTGNTQIILNVTVKSALPTNNTQHFAGGSGTAQDPYIISTKQHLANINEDSNYLSASYKLVNDIVFEDADFEPGGAFYNDGYGWFPIGSPIYWSAGYIFSGVFDGNGFMISGLYSGYSGAGELSSASVGLFGANRGTIKNLGVENGEFQAFSQNRSGSNYSAAGGIAGLNAGTITNCYVKNSYIAADAAGGIAGETYSVASTPTITDCYSGNNKFTLTPAFVSTAFHAHGGIVGYMGAGSINRTYGANYIYAFSYGDKSYYPTAIGGIAGIKIANAAVSNSYYLSAAISSGIYALDGDDTTVGLTPGQMTQLTNLPALSSATWYVDTNDRYRYPQLSSFNRTKQTLFVSKLPDKYDYIPGESLDLDGMQMTLVSTDGSFKVIDAKDSQVIYRAPGDIAERNTIYVEGFDSSSAGKKLLRLYYNELITNFEVYVGEQNKENIIVFEDPELEKDILWELGRVKPEGHVGDITKEDVLLIEVLTLPSSVTSLKGIEHLENLKMLLITSATIDDLSPIAGLTKLADLELYGCTISDLTPIAGLTELTELRLSKCKISDITPIAGLTKLQFLYLDYNNIKDISPLSGLTKLIWTYLNDNEIEDITPLAALSSLSNLKLQNNRIRDISIFAEKGPTTIDFSNNYLDTTPGSATMQIIESLINRTYSNITYLPQKSLGASVSGSVRYYNPNVPVTVSLMQGTETIYTTTTSAREGVGQTEELFSFTDVLPGTYTLELTKASHAKYTVKTVTVGDSDVNLTQDSRPGAQLMRMLCGDINGDGEINQADLNILWQPSNYNKTAANAANPDCDLNGDGEINQLDLNILWLLANYNKGSVVID